MELQIEKRKNREKIEANNINIVLNENTEFRICVNKFGELEITKINFGNGSGSISIEPNVSNQITLK